MLRAIALATLAAAGALLLVRRAQAAGAPVFDPIAAGWTSTIFYPGASPATVADNAAPFQLLPASADPVPDILSGIDFFMRGTQVDEATAQANIAAFLMMIRTAEGTADANGYRRIFGGQLFDSFADHPRRAVTATFGNGLTVTSTAAGAYQFLSTTWDEAKRGAGVPDFSPASQDLAAVFLIKRRGALDDVREGRFDLAVAKCAKEWASLPGSPYGQPTISAERARSLYAEAGGVFA